MQFVLLFWDEHVFKLKAKEKLKFGLQLHKENFLLSHDSSLQIPTAADIHDIGDFFHLENKVLLILTVTFEPQFFNRFCNKCDAQTSHMEVAWTTFVKCFIPFDKI